jgi:hypothetical protein
MIPDETHQESFEELTPEQAELQRQISELESSPAFTDERLRTSVREQDRRLYTETRAKRDELYKRLCPEPAEEDLSNAEAEPFVPDWQKQRKVEAEDEMEKLVELGFTRADIPDDIQPFEVEGLKMQRLNAEARSSGNFSELYRLLDKDLKIFNAKGMGLYQAFKYDGDLDPDERAEHIELILNRLYEAKRIKADRPPRRSSERV